MEQSTPATRLDELRKALLPQQNEAIDAALAALEQGDRAQVLMACGSGKTRIGSSLVVATGARSVIAFFPSLALIKQTLGTWLDASTGFDRRIDWLCVCSDSTVAAGVDELVLTESDLGFAVTTDSQSVRAFLEQDTEAVRVVFSTYHSSAVIAEAIPGGFSFDLGVFDEAHRTTGKDSIFSLPLNDEFVPVTKRVYFTATPKHLSYRKRKRDGEAETVYSMDDESLYGTVAYRLPVREAIQREIISDYRVIISIVDDESISRDRLSQSAIQHDGAVFDAEAVANAIAIRNAVRKYGCKKIITFHDLVRSAQAFAEDAIVQGELDLPIWHVNGSMPSEVRAKIMDGFAASPEGVVTNARCLTEGVDVPAVDMVAFLSPKRASVDIIQAIGRALRRHPAKHRGYVLVPLYVSELTRENLEQVLSESGYDRIWSVIEALREYDDIVTASISNATISIGSGQTLQDLGGFGIVEVAGPAMHLNWLRSVIDTQCIEAIGDTWDLNYGRFKTFVSTYGHADVPDSYVADGAQLGRWCGRQRLLRRRGDLPEERVSRLESLGFNWSP
ncbi:DEAD/DEAH box helicase, partial [Burkholderia stagnalis]